MLTYATGMGCIYKLKSWRDTLESKSLSRNQVLRQNLWNAVSEKLEAKIEVWGNLVFFLLFFHLRQNLKSKRNLKRDHFLYLGWRKD